MESHANGHDAAAGTIPLSKPDKPASEPRKPVKPDLDKVREFLEHLAPGETEFPEFR
jgi:hypothetical protein